MPMQCIRRLEIAACRRMRTILAGKLQELAGRN
jgi:hypothetical protein